MNDIKISIVIVSFNNLKVLRDCINSIYKFNDIGENLEVIVIDNSTDNEIYKYIKNKYDDIVIINNDNKGFGEGNNVGSKISKGEYLIFLNPDTVLIEPIFKFAINKFEKNSNLSIFGVKLLDENFKSNMSYYFIDKHSFFSGQIIRLLNKLNIFISHSMFISGANMFVRKTDFIKAGMFDENIFMYYEESDIIKRLKLIGGEINYFKEKQIIHLEGKTVENIEFAIRRRLDSAKYYCDKYNLDFNKQIQNEIKYNKIKYLIYKTIRDKRQKNIIDTIKIIEEYK